MLLLAEGGGEGEACLTTSTRSEEHTSELQSRSDLVCRLLLEKKKKTPAIRNVSKQQTTYSCQRTKLAAHIPATPSPGLRRNRATATATRVILCVLYPSTSRW